MHIKKTGSSWNGADAPSLPRISFQTRIRSSKKMNTKSKRVNDFSSGNRRKKERKKERDLYKYSIGK